MSAGHSGSTGPPSIPSRPSGYPVSQGGGGRRAAPSSQSSGGTNLADLLERVLDKGIVIAGDITVSLGQVELLSIKLRLVVASIDKAQEIGIDWWRSDPALSSHAQQMELQNRELTARLDRMEQRLQGLPAPQPPQPQPRAQAQAGQPQPPNYPPNAYPPYAPHPNAAPSGNDQNSADHAPSSPSGSGGRSPDGV